MVARYNCYGWDIRRGEMRREDDGEYVRYSDYADLERQIAELRAERDAAVEREREKSQMLAIETHHAEAAEAENARLRALPLKDEVERVLEPFARIADKHHSGYPDNEYSMPIVRVGELRAARTLLSRLRTGEEEGWQELRIAFEAAKYVPGDHPIVPVKIDTFMKTVERLLAAAPSEQGGDRG